MTAIVNLVYFIDGSKYARILNPNSMVFTKFKIVNRSHKTR